MNREEVRDELRSMKEDSFYTISGIDYNVLDKLANDGVDWAEDALDNEYCGDWMIKTGENIYEPATFCSEYPTYTEEEVITMKLEAKNPVITDVEEIKARLIAEGYIDC